MYSLPTRRGSHRKRLSALRLSTDSAVTTLPVYTSPPRHRESDLPDIPSEQPPAYPDSAEEADEDTDTSDDDAAPAPAAFVPSPPHSARVSPRRHSRRSSGSARGHRRQQSIANASDPYLDSLLERSVHALEMSNALLQSSMSTQSSLSAVLADDAADRHLEERTQRVASRIRVERVQQASWMDDLDEISRRVEGLVRGEGEDSEHEAAGPSSRAPQAPISQSLPTSSFEERVRPGSSSSHIRRRSREFRQHHPSSSTSNLQLSVHDRSHFVAPAPRAITMYIDSSEAADEIGLSSTLGMRSETRLPPTPLPAQTAFQPETPEQDTVPVPGATPASAPTETRRRVVDMLASYVMPRASSSTSSPPASTASLRRRSSSSSANTVKRPRMSKSPPPPIRVDTPSTIRSRSVTPCRESSPPPRLSRPLTPPIEELSTSSTSSESATLHVDRTVESLRQILEKQKERAHASGKAPALPPPAPRPSLLSPPTVAPVAGTSNATASVSRLFTRPRYTTSTRAPSPPKLSSMKGSRSAGPSAGPSTPVTPAMPSPSPSLLSVPDLFGLGRSRSAGSSGASTPKRISFVEPESYARTKPEGASAQFRAAKTRSKHGAAKAGRGRGRVKGKGKGKEGKEGEEDSDGEGEGERGGWWTNWLLGAAGTDSASAASRTRSEERYGVRGTWGARPGFGGSLEEWGA